MAPDMPPLVAQVYANMPAIPRKALLALRDLIFETAARSEGVGPLEETLKWGEPAYLTSQTKSGSTIRLGWKASKPEQYALYFNCKTDLIERFRQAFPNDLVFEGRRALLFSTTQEIPRDIVAICIQDAQTYHLAKRSSPN